MDEARPQWKLCFKQGQQRQVYWPADGWYAGGWRDWRYGGGMYWSPDYQVRTVRTLALEVVNSADGAVLWQGQQGGRRRQRPSAIGERRAQIDRFDAIAMICFAL